VMAARILPVYSGRMMRQPVLLSGMVWALFGGAALRSTAELLGGYEGGWAMAVAAGGLLSTGAFTVFAMGLLGSCFRQRDGAPGAAA
jgi:hypothetical protein